MSLNRILSSLLLVVIGILIFNCSDDEQRQEEPILPEVITNLTIGQEDNNLNFSFDIDEGYFSLELAVEEGNVENVSENARFIIIEYETPLQLRLQDLELNDGVYTFFLRAINSAQQPLTQWSIGFSLTINAVCFQPINVTSQVDENFTLGLQWEFDPDAVDVDGVEIRYGIQGFDLAGSNYSTLTVPSPNLETIDFDINPGIIYDFYIRTTCSANTDQSEWAGLLNVVAPGCSVPMNVSYDLTYLKPRFYYESNSSTASYVQLKRIVTGEDVNDPNTGLVADPQINWPSNTFIHPSFSLMSGVWNIFPNVPYEYYLRTVCEINGELTYSEWSDPLLLHITDLNDFPPQSEGFNTYLNIYWDDWCDECEPQCYTGVFMYYSPSGLVHFTNKRMRVRIIDEGADVESATPHFEQVVDLGYTASDYENLYDGPENFFDYQPNTDYDIYWRLEGDPEDFPDGHIGPWGMHTYGWYLPLCPNP